MNWIKEILKEARQLEVTIGKLRSFGLLVGGVMAALGLWIAVTRGWFIVGEFLIAVGLGLFLAGLAVPGRLVIFYRLWMTLALFLGWIVSRIILTLFYFAVLTPIAILARLKGKKFLQLERDPDAPSYWIKRDPDRKVNYEKMY
ncbi:MAG: hypothetical protein GXO78_02590 [Calditrichaeota bacterium]|nr:hypothetical protein [Calditrichota bacterium]